MTECLKGESQAIQIHASEFLYLLPRAFQQPQIELDNMVITASSLLHAHCSQRELLALVLAVVAFLVHVLRSRECILMILVRKWKRWCHYYCYFNLARVPFCQSFQPPLSNCRSNNLPSIVLLDFCEADTGTGPSHRSHQGSSILCSASPGPCSFADSQCF